MIDGMLDELVIEHRECHFTTPPHKTYAVWFDDVDASGSDDTDMMWSHGITIELYAYDSKASAEAEEKIENYLINHGIEYQKQARYWIKSEQLYQTIFSFTVISKCKGLKL